MQLKVTVTQEDIEKGKKNNPKKCPFARACKRVFKKGTLVNIYDNGLDIGSQMLLNTKELSKFINKFDEGKVVKPHTFVINYYHRELEEYLK